ncbi:MAG TPA: hypothetical protein VFA90_17940 [Terriglobales bacterium]|nr:hypothetical protein [Terriglobales bacterium]
MFGNRKPRPKEEDDSLVPHGLIWYATEPAPPEEKPIPENSTLPSDAAQIAKPQEDQPPTLVAESSAANPAQAPSTISDPPQPVAQIRRSISAFAPAPMPPRHAESPDIKHFTAQTALKHIHVAEVIEIEPASSDERTLVARGAVWLRSSTTAGWNWASSRWESVGRNLGYLSTSVEMRRRVHQGRQLTGELLRNGIGFSRRYSETAERAVMIATRNGLKQQRRLIDRVRLGVAAATVRTSTYVRTNGFKSRRVKVIATGLPLKMRISLARRMSAWKMTGTGADARLRTSMALAAFSALIVLIIVSIIPHFAAKSLPSQMFPHPSTVSANTARPVVSTEPVVTSAPADKPMLKVAELTTTKPVPKHKPVATSAQPQRRKLYRTAEDDYIAPNTYVYYGNKAVSR